MSSALSSALASAGPALPSHASARLTALATAVLKAAETARPALRRRLPDQMTAKGPRDYQTEIDVAVERLLVDELSRAFPDHAIQGEEAVGDRAAREGAPIIHIDPIDGTTNFAWGLPHFAITVCIVEAGAVTAGIVYDPMLDELFSAEQGAGAFLNGERIACIEHGKPEDALVGAGLPVPGQVKAVSPDTYFAALKRLMDTTAGVRRLGSAALSIAYVACGRLDGFFEDGLSVHDYGAAALLVREAGGVVTAFSGGPVTPEGDILAASKALHGWLAEGLR
ncbi:inositol monophosphatase [Xaviernesmea oryzae]|uniref:Inositol-1-monophosphatase n=1 Tax=Xaviernesmea oryzae TaxID=464029 RepID=A0A1Q9ATV3_9HYPH|nr:inositol monophosphatase family protein [Xaviernesmea oryzae]OLP58867.1 inositol monophosphatase [Xaviernesmea oryzae]SEM03421.1 myo-inositol-1(or 4)-monophosphatase [Xaviernesmea oryzae]